MVGLSEYGSGREVPTIEAYRLGPGHHKPTGSAKPSCRGTRLPASAALLAAGPGGGL